MNMKGHLIGGLIATATYTAITKDFGLTQQIAIMIGSILPDLDSKQSYISKKLRKFNVITMINDFYPNRFTKHRGILLHSILTVILIAIIMLLTNIYFFGGLLLGVLTHHILDQPKDYFLRNV
jgi:membrane-bound metal-dependent hydrolase YbcI (DUF457 family)